CRGTGALSQASGHDRRSAIRFRARSRRQSGLAVRRQDRGPSGQRIRPRPDPRRQGAVPHQPAEPDPDERSGRQGPRPSLDSGDSSGGAGRQLWRLLREAVVISTSSAAEVARGVSRLLIQEGYSPILEFTLPNGRRLDVAAIGPGGEMLGVEIKVALADLKGDNKWPEYLDYCDLFYFAIPPDFPDEHVPQQTGLIVADRYGGAIVKEAQVQSLHASRRKAVTVSFARCAAERLSRTLE